MQNVTPIKKDASTFRSQHCRLKTATERVLLFLLLVVGSLCAVLVMMLLTLDKPARRRVAYCMMEKCINDTCLPICLTEDCIKAGAALLQNMDLSVNPCDDFYQFSCGRWHHDHDLPSDRPHYDTFSLMKDQVKTRLRNLLEEPITDEDSNATIMAKHLYMSCMNEEIIDEIKERPLLALLDELGGWPVISTNWTEEDFDWVRLAAIMKTYSNDILFSEWVGPDGKNSSVYIIQIDQADLGLPSREYYAAGTEQLAAYEKFMIAVAKLLGASDEQARQEMGEILEFETILCNLTIPNEERRNFTAIYHRITLQDLQLQIPLINWTLYFSIVMPTELSKDEELVVYAAPFLRNMSQLVADTPKRIVANYILWRFVYNRVNNLDKRFMAILQEYYNALFGTQTIPARWESCTMYVNKNLGMAVGSLFVKKHFNEKSKESAEEMIADIKNAFLELMDEVDWMDNQTRNAAKRKAESITQKIGFPEYILNSTELDKDYDGIILKSNTYFANILMTLQHYHLQEQMQLGTLVDKTKWVTSPAVINAFYTRSKNLVSFPAGILQPPLFHQNYLKSLNYGGIGVVIGHELTHGFDDKGRQFDQEGNLKQWWNKESLAKFQAKAECMINQYGEYVMTDIDMKINGINTQGENIADNGGVKQAFKAFKTWESRNGPEPLLPGLNLTHHQLFFLSYAQIWCGTMRPEAAVNTIRASAHSPGRFRVIGALSNSKDFSKAFGCPLGSPMNPVHKCEVW